MDPPEYVYLMCINTVTSQHKKKNLIKIGWYLQGFPRKPKRSVPKEKNHQKNGFFEISDVPDVDKYCKNPTQKKN